VQRDRILGCFAYCLCKLGIKALHHTLMRVNRAWPAIHRHALKTKHNAQREFAKAIALLLSHARVLADARRTC
jgi:hypothetical protein